MYKNKMLASFLMVALFNVMLLMPVGVSNCGCGGSEEYQPINNEVNYNAATDDSIDELCGLVEPENWWVDAEFDPCPSGGDLPDYFDWRDIDGIDYTTPIKNQDGCGSCWAFGTVAPLECNIKIKDGVEVNLSEQWLVSCNQDGWSCSGGWWAHDYHQWKVDYCGGTGAVLEEYFPYEAENAHCDCPYPHDYLIENWAFIGTSYGVPPVDSIKQAIMDYGPVSAAVCVNWAWKEYTGGVFSGPSCSNINHAVALVGWDDNQGSNGVWFLRNSWGTDWGEEGYMRIEYGCCRIGYAACYVDYPGVPATELEVDINSGFGLNIDIINVGDEKAINLECNISVKGGIFGLVNVSYENGVSSLEPNDTIREELLLFGLGTIGINVAVDASNAEKITKTLNAVILFGILVILPDI